MEGTRIEKETIWHFTCGKCKGWWSVATTETWIPEKLFCTHCGERCYTIEKKDRKN